MAKINGRNDLLEKLARLVRSESTLSNQVVKQLPTRHMLQNKIQIFLILVNVNQLEYVIVLQ